MTTTKDLTFVSLEEEEKEVESEKMFEEIMARNFSKFGKRHKLTDLKS